MYLMAGINQRTNRVKSKEVADQVAGIPGMNGRYPLISSRGYFLTYDPVMLHIVDQLQQAKSQKTLGKEKYRDLPGYYPGPQWKA